MDLKKYDELRKRINTKDFEGKNKGLDRWLWRFSFIGNASSIFFAYFLVYPALLKTITLHFLTGFWGQFIALSITLIFLVIFEIIKRYLIRNFSSDFVAVDRKVTPPLVGWLMVSTAIIGLSFYLSITGSKNLAQTSLFRNVIAETEVSNKGDSIMLAYEVEKRIFEVDNEALRAVNNDLRQKLAETPVTYRTIRNEYQSNIDKNVQIIIENQERIDEIDNNKQTSIAELKERLTETKSEHESDDNRTIFLFVIIVIFNELVIISGVFFREYFEYTLYQINNQKFERIYQKRDRYRSLLAFVYGDGRLGVGDKVMPGLELKTIVAEKTTIPNSNKLIDEFLQDMDRLGIFATTGKRRYIAATHKEALDIVENYDNAFRAIENMK